MASVRFSQPVSVTRILSSIRTPPTSQNLSRTAWSMNLLCLGSSRYGLMMNSQK